MGLDTVELVMAIEDEFGIQIQNQDAARLGIIGDLYDHVIQILKQRGETPDEIKNWERFIAVVVQQTGVKPDKVERSTRIVEDLKLD